MSVPLVLGLDFGGTKIAAAVADLKGRRLAEETILTNPARGARWNLEAGLEVASTLLDQAGDEGELVAVGASTFGIPIAGGVLLAVAIPGWGELDLRRAIESGLRCDVVRLITDVKAAAAAEARSGALVGADPAIYLNLGTGLAVGIVCGGRVIAGANGAAGEIGYCLRTRGDLERDPADRVLLEQAVSGMALSAVAERETGLDLSAADVFAAESGDEALASALDEFIDELSFHLVNLSVALNPERIAVGGGIVRSWARIEPKIARALETSVPFPPELVRGAFPYDAPLVGAIALGLEAHDLVGCGAVGRREPHLGGLADGDGIRRARALGSKGPVCEVEDVRASATQNPQHRNGRKTKTD